MPLGDKLGRPFELLRIGRKKKEDARDEDRHLSGSAAQAYSNATGYHSHAHSHSSHAHGHSHHSAGYAVPAPAAAPQKSGFYPSVQYERLTPATATAAPTVKYERLTPANVNAPVVTGPETHSSPMDYDTAARAAAFPSPDTAPSDTVASSAFRSTPSPALSSLPSPGMLTPLPGSNGTPGVNPKAGRSPTVESIRVPPRRVTPPNATSGPMPAVPEGKAPGTTSAPFKMVMGEWISQLRTPTPDVTLLPSPFDFNQDTPTPVENGADLRRLQDALLPTPPPDVHDQRQSTKTAAYILSASNAMARGQRPLLEDIASLCRDLNSQDLAEHQLKTSQAGVGVGLGIGQQMEHDSRYANVRAMRSRQESESSYTTDGGMSEGQVGVLASAAAAMSSTSTASTPTAGGKGKRRKMCTAEGCQNLSRSRGLCKAHGGGRRCSVDGCSRASQSGSLCITHGGGKRCTVEGCVKAAQSRGMCKAHGGGVRCRVEGCTKSSQGDGFCRSHGGGRRCGHPSGCSKWAQRNGMCMAHSEGKYGNSYRGRLRRMQQDGSLQRPQQEQQGNVV